MRLFQQPISNTELNEKNISSQSNAITMSIEGSLHLYKKIFSCIDLTTLSATDTRKKVSAMCAKVVALKQNFVEMPIVGAVCVYPALVEVASKELKGTAIGVASVAGGFPASQTFILIKKNEIEIAVSKGATEIDVVMPLGLFIEGQYDAVFEEIQILKQACGQAKLKVIIESGALKSPEQIYIASHLCMQAGADFIKTSTGKEFPGASPEAAYVMVTAIKEHYTATGKRVGFKPAGGIADARTALKYYAIVKEVLGEDWLNPKLFRIGASRLANNLLSEIYSKEVIYF